MGIIMTIMMTIQRVLICLKRMTKKSKSRKKIWLKMMKETIIMVLLLLIVFHIFFQIYPMCCAFFQFCLHFRRALFFFLRTLSSSFFCSSLISYLFFSLLFSLRLLAILPCRTQPSKLLSYKVLFSSNCL